MGRYIENVDALPCGATVGIAGIDSYLTKSGTLCSVSNGYPIAPMKFSVAPVVRRALTVTNSAQLPEFVKALKKLSKIDPCLQVITKDTTGECIIAGAGELHIEVALTDLRDFLGTKVDFKISDPIVEYRETVTASSATLPSLAKSPNKHNRLYIIAEPLDENLVKAVEAGNIKTGNLKELSTVLVKDFGWSKVEAAKLWCFSGANCLVDATHGVQYLAEIREHLAAAFEWVINESVLAGEPLHGVKISLVDALLHSDAIHRGGGQLIPTARRAFYAAILKSKPALLEPVFLAEILTEQEVAPRIHPLVMKLRGYVVDEYPKEGTPLYIVKAHIPVSESFALSDTLRGATGGRAFPQLIFSHWQPVPGDPFDAASLCGTAVVEVRKRKELGSALPLVSDYEDKL